MVKIDAEIKDHVDAKGQKVSKQKKSKRSNKAKDETPPPAAVAIRQASVDPQIALFLVTNGSPNAGVQRTQYNIGWGLGVAFSLSDAQIKRASKEVGAARISRMANASLRTSGCFLLSRL